MPVLLPQPKKITWRQGCRRADEAALGLALDPADPAFGDVPPAGRAECYHLVITPERARATAVTEEGLGRARATLRQLQGDGPDGPQWPCCTIVDWPDIRFRCASDWLLNVECNRWGYDWGDGPEAFLARMRRKLDFCALHKINQVWFDGFGWDLDRTGHYRDLMRECNRIARAQSIRLTFAGYGGGYGTSYQKSELYRCGYQGETFLNRQPWPDGEVYACRGLENSVGRQYGSCLCNEGLAAAKRAEMRRFVEAVEPGFMYVHDIDSGTWAASQQSWLMRCDDCRARWPSDELADARGMAGALAEWFGSLARHLHEVRHDGYDAARDLALVFTSPLYGACRDDDETWAREVTCFQLISELIGPVPGVMFGIREQFVAADGSPRVPQLAAALDCVGHGHTAHVIAFAGGDNYTSNDLCSLAAAFTPLYVGAGSVCLSNGGVHEEPVQVINAECLWNAATPRTGVDLSGPGPIAELYRQLQQGHYRPEVIFGEGKLLQVICRDLWGETAGDSMYRAYLAGGASGSGPVSRAWWVVTREVRRLMGDPVGAPRPWESVADDWRLRAASTREALDQARQAMAAAPDDEDIRWFATGLAVGLQFAEVVALLVQDRVRADDGAVAAAVRLLDRLAAEVARFGLVPTDVLGGDPGCWQETVTALAQLAAGRRGAGGA